MSLQLAIRDFRLPTDREAVLSFIDGSQAYEFVIEPNRRLDHLVAAEHFERLAKDVAENNGRMFVAEAGGEVVGWASCSMLEHGVFILESERRYGYVSEVYVAEAHRGQHVGRALIAACEDHFRALGLGTAFIGVLSGNSRAIAAYRASGYADYALEMRKRL